jgi:hypothetical protein
VFQTISRYRSPRGWQRFLVVRPILVAGPDRLSPKEGRIDWLEKRCIARANRSLTALPFLCPGQWISLLFGQRIRRRGFGAVSSGRRGLFRGGDRCRRIAFLGSHPCTRRRMWLARFSERAVATNQCRPRACPHLRRGGAPCDNSIGLERQSASGCCKALERYGEKQLLLPHGQ